MLFRSRPALGAVTFRLGSHSVSALRARTAGSKALDLFPHCRRSLDCQCFWRKALRGGQILPSAALHLWPQLPYASGSPAQPLDQRKMPLHISKCSLLTINLQDDSLAPSMGTDIPRCICEGAISPSTSPSWEQKS